MTTTTVKDPVCGMEVEAPPAHEVSTKDRVARGGSWSQTGIPAQQARPYRRECSPTHWGCSGGRARVMNGEI